MRWPAWLRRTPPTDVSRDVGEELASHIALRIRENEARGLSPDAAREEALTRFGSLAEVADRSARIRGRQGSRRRAFGADCRHAWLAMRRAPRIAISGALVVAAGLGTALAASLVADALLVRVPPGIREPDALRSALDSFDGEHGNLMSYAVFETISRDVPEAQPFVWSHRDLQVIHGQSARVWTGALVAGPYFSAIGTRPYAGRLLAPTDVATRARVAVVSARLARLLVGRPVDLPGQSLTVNGRSVAIVGVAEVGFQGLEAGHPADVWLPISLEPEISTPLIFPDGHRVRGLLEAPGVGWLRGGLRLPAGQAEAAVQARLNAAVKTADARVAPKRAIRLATPLWLSPFSTERERLETVLRPIGWAVALTLLLTGACLGSLFVGRLADRQGEMGIRAALGASRARVLALVLFEILLVVAVGAIVALPAANVMLASAGRLQLAAGVVVADAVPRLDVRAVEWLLAFAGAIVIVSAAGPLGMAYRLAATARPSSSRVVGTGGRVRRVLMAAQVGAACALLFGALVLTRTLGALAQQPLGYDDAAVAFAELSPAASGLDDQERAALVARLLAEPVILGSAGSLPALADEAPYGGQSSLFAEGIGSTVGQFFPIPATRVAGPYFETLGVSLIAGRVFTPADAGRRVVIVSAPLGEIFWPGANPLGRQLRIGGAQGIDHEIVGVAPGLRDMGLRGKPVARLYVPLDADTETLTVLWRTAQPAARAHTLADRIRALDPRLVPLRVGSLETLMRRTIEQRLLLRLITLIIGLGSLVLIAVGVWGLSEASLRSRWREFGVRQALGATRRHIARLALADARFVLLAGGAAGVAGAWQIGRLLQAFLFEVSPLDATSLAIALVLVASATLLGAAWPTRQAMGTGLISTDLA